MTWCLSRLLLSVFLILLIVFPLTGRKCGSWASGSCQRPTSGSRWSREGCSEVRGANPTLYCFHKLCMWVVSISSKHYFYSRCLLLCTPYCMLLAYTVQLNLFLAYVHILNSNTAIIQLFLLFLTMKKHGKRSLFVTWAYMLLFVGLNQSCPCWHLPRRAETQRIMSGEWGKSPQWLRGQLWRKHLLIQPQGIRLVLLSLYYVTITVMEEKSLKLCFVLFSFFLIYRFLNPSYLCYAVTFLNHALIQITAVTKQFKTFNI